MSSTQIYKIDVRHCDGEWSLNEDTAETLTDALYKAEQIAKRLHINESVHVAGYSFRGKRPIHGEEVPCE